MDPIESLKPLPDYPMTLTPPHGRVVITVGGKSDVIDVQEGDQIKVEKDGKYEIIRATKGNA